MYAYRHVDLADRVGETFFGARWICCILAIISLRNLAALEGGEEGCGEQGGAKAEGRRRKNGEEEEEEEEEKEEEKEEKKEEEEEEERRWGGRGRRERAAS